MTVVATRPEVWADLTGPGREERVRAHPEQRRVVVGGRGLEEASVRSYRSSRQTA